VHATFVLLCPSVLAACGGGEGASGGDGGTGAPVDASLGSDSPNVDSADAGNAGIDSSSGGAGDAGSGIDSSSGGSGEGGSADGGSVDSGSAGAGSADSGPKEGGSADSGPKDSGSDASNGDAATCPSAVAPDPIASQRAACAFTTGALVKDTLGISEAARAAIPIKTIIVMMKENRSFDHLLGQIHSKVPAVEPIPPGFTNPAAVGSGTVAPFHQTSTCIGHDPDHQWAAMHTQVDDGGMDGFVKSAAISTLTDGTFAMSYYDSTDLPFYYWLASTYPLNDRHFASARSGTYPDRNFLLLGTADGVQSTGDGYPLSTTPTIFDSLATAGVTWGVYSDGDLLSGTLDWDTGHAGTPPPGRCLRSCSSTASVTSRTTTRPPTYRRAKPGRASSTSR
jgi:hypothetical protein